jgi:hypothetical protein
MPLKAVIGINDGRVPKVPAFVLIKNLGVNRLVWFLVDTGSTYSAICESDALLAGIDPTTLPYEKGEAVGFGGKFRCRSINHPVELIFKTSDSSQFTIHRSGFKLIPAEHKDEAIRRKLLEVTPSVLGMDVLNTFEIHILRKKVELSPYEQ